MAGGISNGSVASDNFVPVTAAAVNQITASSLVFTFPIRRNFNFKMLDFIFQLL